MEKVNLLEKIDNAMREDLTTNYDVTKAKKIIGTCVDICPGSYMVFDKENINLIF